MSERIYYSRAAEERARREQIFLTVMFLALGLSIGTALALLFAPNSGSETRKEIVNTVEGGLESGREVTNQTVKRMEKEISELRKRLEDRLN